MRKTKTNVLQSWVLKDKDRLRNTNMVIKIYVKYSKLQKPLPEIREKVVNVFAHCALQKHHFKGHSLLILFFSCISTIYLSIFNFAIYFLFFVVLTLHYAISTTIEYCWSCSCQREFSFEFDRHIPNKKLCSNFLHFIQPDWLLCVTFSPQLKFKTYSSRFTN